ncbi:5-deoxy-glucuronate isomerase [Bacillota bacterium]
MIKQLGTLKKGYNAISDMDSLRPDMMMDIGIEKMFAGDSINLYENDKESALLLLSGTVSYRWGDESREAKRNSLFDENPVVLHLSKNTSATVHALTDAEILVQKTTNEKDFPPVFYSQEDSATDIFGKDIWGDTARRWVRTVFDYNNAPYSNMVMGEVINFPGKWSSYIPHGHDQPEVYYYRFDRDSGFGAAFLGEDVYRIVDNSAFYITGGPTHPQVSAPGYAMWYCWMIRHLPDNPWTTRVNDPRYTWLLEENPPIWT